MLEMRDVNPEVKIAIYKNSQLQFYNLQFWGKKSELQDKKGWMVGYKLAIERKMCSYLCECFSSVASISSLCCCRRVVALLAGAEREGPAAGLQPRLPQNLCPRQLFLHRRQSSAVLRHGPFDPLQHLCQPRLSVRWERTALWRIPAELEHQRRVVIRHKRPVTHADAGVVTAHGSRWREVWCEEMDLEDGLTWG